MHSSRMRTARSSGRRGGGSPPGTPLGLGTPPGPDTPPGPGTVPCGQTHTCKHITLPQTSFAGGIFNSLSNL